jgi:hypothetical protein
LLLLRIQKHGSSQDLLLSWSVLGLVGCSSPSSTILGESLQCCVGGAAGIFQDLVNIFPPRSVPSVFSLHSTFEDRLDQSLVSYEVTEPDVSSLPHYIPQARHLLLYLPQHFFIGRLSLFLYRHRQIHAHFAQQLYGFSTSYITAACLISNLQLEEYIAGVRPRKETSWHI